MPSTTTARSDSPIILTFPLGPSNQRISTDETPSPSFPKIFLDSPSPQAPQTFLYSPSLSAISSESPVLPAFLSDHYSLPIITTATDSPNSSSSSMLGGAYPTPRLSATYLDSPSGLNRASWCTALSTASTAVATGSAPVPAQSAERMSSILPEEMDFFDEEEWAGELFGQRTRDENAPMGLGLRWQLPLIAEEDFAYYPMWRGGGVERGTQTEEGLCAGKKEWVRGSAEKIQAKKSGGWSGVVRLARRLARKLRMGKCA